MGGIISRVGLITCDQYRELRGNIPEIDRLWWTATADSGKSEYIKIIQPNGRIINDISIDSDVGVRPVCVFDSAKLEKLLEGRKMCSFCEEMEILRECRRDEYKIVTSVAIVDDYLTNGKSRGRTIHYKIKGKGFPLRFCPECGKKLEDINK